MIAVTNIEKITSKVGIKRMKAGKRVRIRCFATINPGEVSIGRPIEGESPQKK
jgi:hypothetical protein